MLWSNTHTYTHTYTTRKDQPFSSLRHGSKAHLLYAPDVCNHAAANAKSSRLGFSCGQHVGQRRWLCSKGHFNVDSHRAKSLSAQPVTFSRSFDFDRFKQFTASKKNKCWHMTCQASNPEDSLPQMVILFLRRSILMPGLCAWQIDSLVHIRSFYTLLGRSLFSCLIFNNKHRSFFLCICKTTMHIVPDRAVRERANLARRDR